MAPLAALLSNRGYDVSGSDTALYPPMSDLIRRSRIPVSSPFSAENVPADCDRVIVGNAVPRGNPEVVRVLELGIPYFSLPEAIRHYLLPGKHSVVVTGTHGKTTTSSLLAWLLFDSGRDPSFLIGGELKNFGQGFRDGAGPEFLLEGDEYNAAFFDRGPKFLHYEPQTLLLNNIEFDHADLYPDVESIESAFERLVALVPEDGVIVANTDDARVARVVGGGAARVLSVSFSRCGLSASEVETGPGGTSFTLVEEGRDVLRLALPLWGRHNLKNALMAIGAARSRGVADPAIAAALPRFQGVKRRLEILGEKNGVLYVDDFAHHPTAVFETLSAARQRWPGRRIWGLFEPRSITAGRKLFEPEYERAFEAADTVVLAPVFHAGRFKAEDLIDRERIGRALERAGKQVFLPSAVEEIQGLIESEARPGDVAILMSSGDFGGLRQRASSGSPDRVTLSP